MNKSVALVIFMICTVKPGIATSDSTSCSPAHATGLYTVHISILNGDCGEIPDSIWRAGTYNPSCSFEIDSFPKICEQIVRGQCSYGDRSRVANVYNHYDFDIIDGQTVPVDGVSSLSIAEFGKVICSGQYYVMFEPIFKKERD